MAATKSKPKKAKRRLKNLVIDEISLVDNPAVPEAEFLIAKRDELNEFDQVVKETAERIAKGDSGTYALQDVLRMTADVIGMIQGLSAIAASGELDDKVVKAVLTMLKQYGVTIAVNNADGVPIDMMAAAVYDNTKSESEVIADDGIEKAQRVLSNQQFKDLSKACDMLKGVVDRARKIGKSDDEESEDETILRVGEAGEALRVDDDTALADAPASPTSSVVKDEDDAEEESSDAEAADVVESVEDASDSTETGQSDEVVEDTIAAATGEDATSDDDGEETESVAEKVAKLWAQRQQEKAQQKKRADDARLNAAASRLGDSLSQLSSRLDRIADRVGAATGSAE